MCACTHTQTQIYAHKHTYTKYTHTHIYTYAYTDTHRHAHICTYMYMYTQTCVHTHTCTCVLQAKSLQSCLTLATPWAVAHQTPLSMGFSRQESWRGWPFPPPGGLPAPGIKPASLMSPALAGGVLTSRSTWEAPYKRTHICITHTHTYTHTNTHPPKVCWGGQDTGLAVGFEFHASATWYQCL